MHSAEEKLPSTPDVSGQPMTSSKSVSRFARDHDICEQSVYNAINAGLLKARKLGRRTLITAEDEKAFIDNLPTIKPRVRAA